MPETEANVGHPSPGVVLVNDAVELPEGETLRAVGDPADVFELQVPGQVELGRFEGRFPDDPGEDIETAVEVLREDGKRHAARFRGDAGLQLDGELLQGVVDLAALHAFRAAVPQELAREVRQALLAFRVVDGPGPDEGGDLDEGKLAVLVEKDGDAVVQDDGLRPGHPEMEGRIAQTLRRRKRRACGEGRQTQQNEGQKGGECLPHGFTPWFVMRTAGRMTATVLFSSVRYLRAAAMMSSGEIFSIIRP